MGVHPGVLAVVRTQLVELVLGGEEARGLDLVALGGWWVGSRRFFFTPLPLDRNWMVGFFLTWRVARCCSRERTP
uniref:Uncharacterized protein n=1 Tax=Arundo donax TaxID=35708 RepID=A0A0A8YRT2_ARUDO